MVFPYYSWHKRILLTSKIWFQKILSLSLLRLNFHPIEVGTKRSNIICFPSGQLQKALGQIPKSPLQNLEKGHFSKICMMIFMFRERLHQIPDLMKKIEFKQLLLAYNDVFSSIENFSKMYSCCGQKFPQKNRKLISDQF